MRHASLAGIGGEKLAGKSLELLVELVNSRESQGFATPPGGAGSRKSHPCFYLQFSASRLVKSSPEKVSLLATSLSYLPPSWSLQAFTFVVFEEFPES